MKHYALLCLSSLVFINLAFAGGQNAPAYGKGSSKQPHKHPHLFTGFAVTGALGGTGVQLGAKQNFTGQSFAGDDATDPHGALGFSVNDTVIDSDKLELFESNFAGLIGLEYNYQFDNGLVLGLAATAGFDNVDFINTLSDYDQTNVTTEHPLSIPVYDSFNTVSTTLKVNLENDFAILFKPGFVVRQNTLIYGLVGPRWGNFETKLSSSYNTQGSTNFECDGFLMAPCANGWDSTLSDSSSNSEYQIGVTAGVGIRQAMSNHFMLGLEYAYTHYTELDSLQNAKKHLFLDSQDNAGDNPTHLYMDYVANAQDLIANTHSVMATLTYNF